MFHGASDREPSDSPDFLFDPPHGGQSVIAAGVGLPVGQALAIVEADCTAEEAAWLVGGTYKAPLALSSVIPPRLPQRLRGNAVTGAKPINRLAALLGKRLPDPHEIEDAEIDPSACISALLKLKARFSQECC